MTYTPTKKPSQQIDKPTNLKGFNVAETIAVYMYSLKIQLTKYPNLFLGNGDYTFIITQGNTIDCAIRYIRSRDIIANARALAVELKKFLNNPEWSSTVPDSVLNFIRTAEVKTEYFT